MRRFAAPFALALALAPAACKSSAPDAAPENRAEPAGARADAPPAPPGAPTAAPARVDAPAAAAPAGPPAPDGKYENVLVEGKRVPMVQVMNGAEVLLVDTDGAKPRTWEEQYKRKGAALKPGQFDLHKTDAARDGRFDDDAVDRQGRWQVDGQGNLTAY
ncbi:MAG TPA: hypothetical protein VFS00_26180 [Polyangiaceae bacterium]|nr:hypothetical protein [Polyangiaceae bacterium]